MEHVNEDCQCEGKICTKCEKELCVGNYTKDKRLKSKLKAQCRDCQNAAYKEWRRNNLEYDNKRHQIYVEEHKEQVEQREKRYKQAHKERARVLRRLHREKYREKYRERDRKRSPGKSRKYYQENKERVNAQWKEYYYNNKEYLRGRVAQWRQTHHVERAAIQSARKTRKTQAGGSYTAQEWEALKAMYDYTCLCCGKQEPEIKLTADHIIPIVKNGNSFISNIQPLCQPCNSRKGRKIIDFRPKTS